MKSLKGKIIWLSLFSIAMGFMETAVVVYLRKIYYPAGFTFPLQAIDVDIAITEFYREIATIIMLVGIGLLAGKNTLQKFSFFIYCFAIWDLFYYVFLKVLLNWPESLFTWDILFLVPIPWVGPVIAPCIVSLTMIILALLTIYYNEKSLLNNFLKREWLQLIAGSCIIIFSFMIDYINYSASNQFGNAKQINVTHTPLQEVGNYIPQEFAWGVFSIGELLIVFTIASLVLRLKHPKGINATITVSN